MHIPQTSSKSHSHLDSNRLITADGFSMSIDKAGKLIIFTLTLQTPPHAMGCAICYSRALITWLKSFDRKKGIVVNLKNKYLPHSLSRWTSLTKLIFLIRSDNIQQSPRADYYLCIVISNFLYAIVTCRNRLRSCCARQSNRRHIQCICHCGEPNGNH